jgi:hypothetical protein
MSGAACELADEAPSTDSKAEYLRLASAWQKMALDLELELSAASGAFITSREDRQA